MSDKAALVFTVEYINEDRHVVADSLLLRKDGSLHFRTAGRLTGVIKHGNWYRCYVEAPKVETKK